jgi:hypothetical protein
MHIPKGVPMPLDYESPEVKVLGTVTDMTLAKPGIYFDFAGSLQGNDDQPAPGTPGTS